MTPAPSCFTSGCQGLNRWPPSRGADSSRKASEITPTPTCTPRGSLGPGWHNSAMLITLQSSPPMTVTMRTDSSAATSLLLSFFLYPVLLPPFLADPPESTPFITPFNSIPIPGSASREPGLILFSGSFLSSRETYFQAHTQNLNRHVKP